MKITLFGGGGFIGSAIADRLLKDGHSLRIFERQCTKPYRQFYHNENVEWITGDMMSTNDVSVAIDGVDVVLHLVSTTLPKNSNDDMVYDVESNLVTTLKLLSIITSKRVPKIVFISSGGTIYGNPIYLPIDENHPTNPRVSYGITKLGIEKYLLLNQQLNKIKVNILRVANSFGERQQIDTAQGAVGIFLNKAIQNQPLEIWGDGNIIRDYVYVSDVAEAFARAVCYDGEKSVFNISSGVGTSLNELIDTIEQVLGYKVVRNYRPGRLFDIKENVLDSSLAQKELEWKPQIKLKEGIIKTVEWMRKQQDVKF